MATPYAIYGEVSVMAKGKMSVINEKKNNGTNKLATVTEAAKATDSSTISTVPLGERFIPTNETAQRTADMIASSIEALLFASDEPIPIKLLIEILSEFYKESKQEEVIPFLKPELLRVAINDLNKGYSDRNQSFHIIEIAGGFQFATLQEHAKCLGILFKEKSKRRLSQSALETLAIIAFKQPISKPDIETIRGVNCDYVLNTLLEKDLVAITGRADSVGRPLLYGTTSRFLKHFGLKDSKDMPKLKEVEEIMNSEEFKFEVKRLDDSLNKNAALQADSFGETDANGTNLTNESTTDNIPIIVEGPISIQATEKEIEDSSPESSLPEKFLSEDSSSDTLDDVKKKPSNGFEGFSIESYAALQAVSFGTINRSSSGAVENNDQKVEPYAALNDTISPASLSFLFDSESSLTDVDVFLFDINFDTAFQYGDNAIDEITQELIENAALQAVSFGEINRSPSGAVENNDPKDDVALQAVSFGTEQLPEEQTEYINNDADILEEYPNYVLEGSPILTLQNFSYDEPEETKIEEATVNDVATLQSQEKPEDEKQEIEFIQDEIKEPLFEEWRFNHFIETEMFQTKTIESDNIFSDIKFNPIDLEIDLKNDELIKQKSTEDEKEINNQETKVQPAYGNMESTSQFLEQKEQNVLPNIELNELTNEKIFYSESETMQDKYLDFSLKKNEIDNNKNLVTEENISEENISEGNISEENILEESEKVDTFAEQKKSLRKNSFFTKFKLIVIGLLDKIKKFFSKLYEQQRKSNKTK
jgi:segregation and condensation protein B